MNFDECWMVVVKQASTAQALDYVDAELVFAVTPIDVSFVAAQLAAEMFAVE